MMPPTSIDGTDITGATIDGTDVQEITVDGDTVFTAGPPILKGEDVYVTERSGNTVRHDSLSTPFDLSTATDQATISVSGDPRGVDIRPDGTSIYEVNKNDVIRQYDLSTPYDLSSAGSPKPFATQTPHGMDISPTGEDAIITKTSTPRGVYHGVLSTPFEIQSLSLTQVFSGDDSYGGSFGDNGNIVIYISRNLGQIQELELSTPYDVSTATKTQTASLDGSDERGIEFGDDGNLLFTTDRVDGLIRKYTLSIPFDITTKGSPVTFSTDVTDTNGISFPQ